MATIETVVFRRGVGQTAQFSVSLPRRYRQSLAQRRPVEDCGQR